MEGGRVEAEEALVAGLVVGVLIGVVMFFLLQTRDSGVIIERDGSGRIVAILPARVR